MTKVQRVAVFITTLLILILVYYLTYPLASPDIDTLIFTSLITLSFVILFIEHFFSTPTDVLANSLAILIVLAPLRLQLSNMGIWYWIVFIYTLVIGLAALISLLLVAKNQPANSTQNRIASGLKTISVTFGNGKVLYFLLFISAMFFYVNIQSNDFLILFIYASLLLLINPSKSLPFVFSNFTNRTHEIGEIIAVHSDNIFMIKLYEGGGKVQRFDVVNFAYSMDDEKDIRLGLVIDKYFLNKEQWARVLSVGKDISAYQNKKQKLRPNIVNIVEKPIDLPEPFSRIVGIVVDNSKIEKIRFEYKPRLPITEGQLLEVEVAGKKVFYQVVQGITNIEDLKSQDETGYIVGEAIQLGEWIEESRVFERYGWVPNINAPIYVASDIDQIEENTGDLHVGNIPNSRYPVFLKMVEAISHHIAVLGVTGCGKSVFARYLIRNIIKSQYKVICIDFTNEYREKFKDIGLSPIIPDDRTQPLFDTIDTLSLEQSKFRNQQNPKLIQDCENYLRDEFNKAIRDFYTSDTMVSLFELPDVSNTTGIFEYTKWFFRILFEIARKENNLDKKICIVLEEAHTVIPEWTFIGASEKEAQSLVNNIGQIALQGRKYNVGFVVIAQRTANVSKTVLTQCNTIVAFRQHDNTSREFLSNYLSGEMTSALGNLKFKQAIAVGKAFATGVPVIFDVIEINE